MGMEGDIRAMIRRAIARPIATTARAMACGISQRGKRIRRDGAIDMAVASADLISDMVGPPHPPLELEELAP
jgi:hypothetical protein